MLGLGLYSLLYQGRAQAMLWFLCAGGSLHDGCLLSQDTLAGLNGAYKLL